MVVVHLRWWCTSGGGVEGTDQHWTTVVPFTAGDHGPLPNGDIAIDGPRGQVMLRVLRVDAKSTAVDSVLRPLAEC